MKARKRKNAEARMDRCVDVLLRQHMYGSADRCTVSAKVIHCTLDEYNQQTDYGSKRRWSVKKVR